MTFLDMDEKRHYAELTLIKSLLCNWYLLHEVVALLPWVSRGKADARCHTLTIINKTSSLHYWLGNIVIFCEILKYIFATRGNVRTRGSAPPPCITVRFNTSVIFPVSIAQPKSLPFICLSRNVRGRKAQVKQTSRKILRAESCILIRLQMGCVIMFNVIIFIFLPFTIFAWKSRKAPFFRLPIPLICIRYHRQVFLSRIYESHWRDSWVIDIYTSLPRLVFI